MKLAVITPTKDRPQDIRKMLHSFMAQSHRPDQVIIVDSSSAPVSAVVDEFPALKINYKRWTEKPSAAGQRNGGIELLQNGIDLVCFFDDDQVLHPDAIEKMLAFWESEVLATQGCLAESMGVDNNETRRNVTSGDGSLTPEEKPLGAASFFDASWWDLRPSLLKKSKISEMLGLYTRKPGGVASSGWQSLYYGMVKGNNLDVEWLSSQAIVLKRPILDEFSFDEFFEGYSYLEDLDFSYSISRKYRMTVVADAKFDHFNSPAGRGSRVDFGKIEVRNRRYIVRKHGLSMASYRLAMFVRFCMSLRSGDYARARGNIRVFLGG